MFLLWNVQITVEQELILNIGFMFYQPNFEVEERITFYVDKSH